MHIDNITGSGVVHSCIIIPAKEVREKALNNGSKVSFKISRNFNILDGCGFDAVDVKTEGNPEIGKAYMSIRDYTANVCAKSAFETNPPAEKNDCEIRDLPLKDESILTITGHSERVRTVTFSPDGLLIASGAYDNTVKLWDARSGDEVRVLEGHSKSVRAVAFSIKGIVASGSDDKTIILWEASSGTKMHTLRGHTRGVNTVNFSPDGKMLVSGSYDQSLKIWDTEAGNLIRDLPGHPEAIWAAEFSPKDLTIASGSRDKSVKIWDLRTNEVFHTLEGHSMPVCAISFSWDGKMIASGSADKDLKIWDTEKGEELRTLVGHKGYVRSVAFSPSGSMIASGSDDSTIKLWDSETGEELRTFVGHSDGVWSVRFSPDGSRIVSGSKDGKVKLWDTSIRLDREKIRELFVKNGVNRLYHFTDIRNLPLILKEGKLLSNKILEEKKLMTLVKCGGNQLSRSIDVYPDRIKLSPCPQTPMAHNIDVDLRDNLHTCYLIVSLDVALNRNVLFTDINSASSKHNRGTGIGGVKLLDFGWINNPSAHMDDDGFKKKQAEILVPNCIALNKIEKICFISEESLVEANRLCDNKLTSGNIKTEVNPSFFYRSFYAKKVIVNDMPQPTMRTELILKQTYQFPLRNKIYSKAIVVAEPGSVYSFRWFDQKNQPLQEDKNFITGMEQETLVESILDKKLTPGNYRIEFYLNDVYQSNIGFKVKTSA